MTEKEHFIIKEKDVQPVTVKHAFGDAVFRELAKIKDVLFVVGILYPGSGTETHTHGDSTEIYYVISGHPTFQVGSEKIEGETGDVIVIPPGTNHSVKNDSGIVAKVVLIHVPN